MDHHPTPLPRRLAAAAESSPSIASAARALRPVADALTSAPRWNALLRGEPLGHAAHPALTDIPVGLWLSSCVLDVAGSDDGRSADRLLGLGILAAAPAALTGLADWRRGGERVRAVGALHAALNSGALALYVGSWALRRRGIRRPAVAVSLAAGTLAGASAYLGGHLTLVLGSPHDQQPSTTEPDPEPESP
ncbi:hypothetical protein IC607_08460 [Cellulomonas sp. JH27-2]|uniref:DUF2231 domain-containing protein n=1 Tax=Cellulomonas sp. JH27-2 TaxID=2774139 RepID=UPI0017877009|nr:DUF2231 domain-containing protein [Cellulomonas sp. JH27-2]MBD8058999.1 hypothetical protein [Cellulomonas sp. JH27-2]